MFYNGNYTKEQVIGIRYRLLFMKKFPHKLLNEKGEMNTEKEFLGDQITTLIPCLKSNLSPQDQLNYELQVLRYYQPKDFKDKLNKEGVTIDELIEIYPFFIDFVPNSLVTRELVHRMTQIEIINDDLWQDYKPLKMPDGSIEYQPYPHSDAFHELELEIPTFKYVSTAIPVTPPPEVEKEVEENPDEAREELDAPTEEEKKSQ